MICCKHTGKMGVSSVNYSSVAICIDPFEGCTIRASYIGEPQPLIEGVRYTMIEMTVESVRINLQTSQRVVILKAAQNERYLFIWIAHAEAYAIAIELQGTSSPRPLTHDLLKNVIEDLGAKIESIVISDLIDDIFYARIVLDVAGRHVEVDSRPSDAIALAVRARTPIYVEESVLERAGVALEASDDTSISSKADSRREREVEYDNLDAYRDFINSLDALDEFGKD